MCWCFRPYQPSLARLGMPFQSLLPDVDSFFVINVEDSVHPSSHSPSCMCTVKCGSPACGDMNFGACAPPPRGPELAKAELTPGCPLVKRAGANRYINSLFAQNLCP